MNNYQKQMEDAGYMRLSQDHIRKIFNDGFCYVEIQPGHTVRVTADDLNFNAEEVESLIKKLSDEKNRG